MNCARSWESGVDLACTEPQVGEITYPTSVLLDSSAALISAIRENVPGFVSGLLQREANPTQALISIVQCRCTWLRQLAMQRFLLTHSLYDLFFHPEPHGCEGSLSRIREVWKELERHGFAFDDNCNYPGRTVWGCSLVFVFFVAAAGRRATLAEA